MSDIVYGEKEDAISLAVYDTTGEVLLESEARDIIKHLEGQGWELSRQFKQCECGHLMERQWVCEKCGAREG